MSIINLQTGDFQITDQISISKTKSFSDVLKLAPNNKIWDVKNGYKWIYFKDIIIDDLFFYINVCFHDEKLFSIDFFFTEKKLKKTSWDDYNEDAEIKKKDLYEKWLIQTIGKKRDFEWGKISAYFDPRGGSSSMYIKYS